MTAPTPFGYDHSTGPSPSDIWRQAAEDSAAERAERKCARVLGTSTVDGPRFLNGRPGDVLPDGRREWLCDWPAVREDVDGVPVCGSHAVLEQRLPREDGR